MSDKRLWVLLGVVLIGTFTLLGFFGREIYRQAPPIPERVVTDGDAVLTTRERILDGQQVWQSIGGQQVGSIWGHGAYQAPDWSADWLHREALALLDVWSRREASAPFAALDDEAKGGLERRLRTELRENHFDAATGTLTVGDDRAAAIAETAKHYRALFGGAPELAGLRESYAMPERPIEDSERLERLTEFFFWTSWACVARRPGETFSYTNDWPHEPLVGNEPSGALWIWSLVSIVLLLAGIAALAWFHHARARHEPEVAAPRNDPLDRLTITPSMRAVGKYGVVVVALFVVPVLLGALVAHYTVEGDSFFGFDLAAWLPYPIARTWHLQTAVFWIATAFLATGLFLAPVIGGREPRHQRLGVDVLFGALLVVVTGSLVGEWLSVQQKLSFDASFWIGHQGYEYVDLGRVWQIALYVGMVLWLVLMLRGIWPALRRGAEHRQLVTLLGGSVVAIGLLYGVGFFYGARSNLSVAEYWRWWIVHLWVEGFFEVFATGVLAYLFVRLGLVRGTTATRGFLASTAMFLLGGIPGTFHHIYFSGTPLSVTAVGATFSALEVVPLVLIGKEAMETLRAGRAAPWMAKYRWTIRCFVGVAFWNLVGAGLFGFLINPPIALYHMQGLNTTPVHAHTALFGVYGLLSLGLIGMLARRLAGERPWREGTLTYAFWSMNVGLGAMVALSLLPIGLIQTAASVEHGMWYARSAEFLQQPVIETLRWLRIVGDTVFLSGVATLAWFTVGLGTGWSFERPTAESTPALDAAAS